MALRATEVSPARAAPSQPDEEQQGGLLPLIPPGVKSTGKRSTLPAGTGPNGALSFRVLRLMWFVNAAQFGRELWRKVKIMHMIRQ